LESKFISSEYLGMPPVKFRFRRDFEPKSFF
jgi:hypothetical protein